jgi:hypothetical protein
MARVSRSAVSPELAFSGFTCAAQEILTTAVVPGVVSPLAEAKLSFAG